MRAVISHAIAGGAIVGAGMVGLLLPADVPWMPPVAAHADVRVQQTSSTSTPTYSRWHHRGDGWKAYNDWTGVNNGCRGDFELSYAGLVKKSKVTKTQKKENELIPPHSAKIRKAGYVHLIEKDQQEYGEVCF